MLTHGLSGSFQPSKTISVVPQGLPVYSFIYTSSRYVYSCTFSFQLKKRVPVATVSPQPQSQTCTPRPSLRPRPLKSLLRPNSRDGGAGDSVESLEGANGRGGVNRRAALGQGDRVTSAGTRPSAGITLAASLSELSTSGTEDGFELDYYDYGCHEVPGSFFSQQVVGGWPPFLPFPGEDELLELQLQNYTLPPPTETTDISAVVDVHESEDEQ